MIFKKFVSVALLVAFSAQTTLASPDDQAITPKEWKQIISERQAQLESMSESEIRANLLGAAAELQNKINAGDLDNGSIAKLQEAIALIASSAAADDIKKGLGLGLKRAGQSLFFGVGMAGSTVSQITLAPIVGTWGFFQGLITGRDDRHFKKDKNGNYDKNYRSSENITDNKRNGAAIGLTIFWMVELAVFGKDALGYVFVGGIMADAIYLNMCDRDAKSFKDQYNLKLCRVYAKYRRVIIDTTSLGTSTVGAAIHNGVGFVLRGFKKKKQEVTVEKISTPQLP